MTRGTGQSHFELRRTGARQSGRRLIRNPEPDSTAFAEVAYPTADTTSCGAMCEPLFDKILCSIGLAPTSKERSKYSFQLQLAGIACRDVTSETTVRARFYTWAALARGEGRGTPVGHSQPQLA